MYSFQHGLAWRPPGLWPGLCGTAPRLGASLAMACVAGHNQIGVVRVIEVSGGLPAVLVVLCGCG